MEKAAFENLELELDSKFPSASITLKREKASATLLFRFALTSADRSSQFFYLLPALAMNAKLDSLLLSENLVPKARITSALRRA